jgi:hypothetical protein
LSSPIVSRSIEVREVEPAAHAAGIGSHQPVAGLDEAKLLEHPVGARAGRPPVLPEQAGDQLQVLVPAHRRLDRRELARQADIPAHRLCLATDVVAGNPQRACVEAQ